MSEKTELLVIEKLELVPFFTKGDGIDNVLEQIAKEARSIVHDVSTAKGRDAVKAHVTKVTKSKTYLEAQGKALAAEYKEIPKKIDVNRKSVWDFLDNLQKEVRQPLTDWEDEQAKIKAEEEARLAAEENQRVIDSDYEIAFLLMERDFNLRQEAAEEADRQRIAYEENLRLEGARKAQEAALLAIEQEKAASIEREQKAKFDAEQAEIRRVNQEIAAEQALVSAEVRRLADIEATKQAEIDRQEIKRKYDETLKAKLAADADHVAQVHRDIKAVYIAAGFPDEWATKATKLLVNHKIPNSNFNY
jgi:colicin import membrane protein